MGDRSSIEWTDATWNPVRGCSRVSPGCENCYAESVARRFSGPGLAYAGVATSSGWNRKVLLVPEHLDDPLHWYKPRRVFVNSMSDLFHETLDGPTVARVFGVMAAARWHTFQILTKRAGHMREMLNDHAFRNEVQLEAAECGAELDAWPLPNVWLGVSVEDQRRADERIPHLLATPAAVRFLSCEPLLGPVQLGVGGAFYDYGFGDRSAIHWVIIGGESGPGARPMWADWARSLVAQCKGAEVACFVKQLGAAYSDPGMGIAGARLNVHPDAAALVSLRLRDRKGGDPAEWPEDLRVRQFPEVRP